MAGVDRQEAVPYRTAKQKTAYISPTTGSDPPSCSWTMSPRIPIMAARPLFNSMA
eukprot:CAMPEP_0168180142 /NCGR_PEP_ID=MMETSP0139_2-20121125/10318_1 /TAXON_ID=44445 /ORGANISM="Pseudo-nitzschia australis, Strain 10249 10 AB" /LENGTH=54 /DNA_ID=CAMNT_0008100217 /DNA_START=111 /DNA_END=272 /DNA_ORIENTATION=-